MAQAFPFLWRSGIPDFLSGGGKVGEALRAMNWSASSLGEPRTWPQGLRSMVRFMLTTGTPASLYWGPERLFLYNDAMGALIGGERHLGALGRAGSEVWSEIWSDIGPQIDQVMEGSGGLTHRETHYRITRDQASQDTWWDYSQSPIDDPASPGGVGGVLVLAVEVTEQRRAREALSAQRERLLSIFDNSASFLAMAEGPEHRFALTNQSYLSLIGRDNVIGLTVREALPEVVDQGLIAALDRVYATGEPFVARNLPLVLHRRQDGSPDVRRLNFVYHRLTDESGAPVGILAEGHDITEIMAGKDALRAANQALSAILEHSPDLICALSESGEINLVSSSCQAILGYSPAEMVGRSLTELIHPEDRDGATEIHKLVMAQESILHHELRLTRADGSPVAIRWSAVHSPDLQTIYAVGHDITEDLEKERRLRHAQKIEAVGRITAGVAHDFNNLLTVATIAAEAIAATSSDAALTAQAGMILGAAERGADLVKRLLAFSRRQSLSPQSIDVGALLFGLRPLIEIALGDAVTLKIEDQAGFACLADFAQLEAAIFNLCINARDAMPDGGRITVSVQDERIVEAAAPGLGLQSGDYVVITVADNGQGMTPDVLERAIEPFFTTKAEGGGSGLGLSMAYGFARQSGGQFAITSRPDEGAAVRIHLPRAASPAPAQTVAQTVAPTPPGKAHILVVEDDDSVRASVAGYLKGLGYQISSAADGPAALALIGRDDSIDLLFTDMEMPGGMNGRQLADRAWLLHPTMPVLFSSGYTEDEVVSRGGLVRAGCDFLQKPYRRANLALALARMLGVMPSKPDPLQALSARRP